MTKGNRDSMPGFARWIIKQRMRAEGIKLSSISYDQLNKAAFALIKEWRKTLPCRRSRLVQGQRT